MMSAMCQKQTLPYLFDRLVGAAIIQRIKLPAAGFLTV
jgi:hypothetical protein